MGVRTASSIKLVDYEKFVEEMRKKFPSLTVEEIADIWNFGNDCWSDGYRSSMD